MYYEDYSVFYYTYSTISQTLAGLMGFLVAAALIRLGQTERAVEKASKKESGPIVKEIIRLSSEGENEPIVRELRDTHHKSKMDYVQVRRRLRLALRLTGITIMACLFLMPLTSERTRFGYSYVAWPCLVVTVTMAGGCLLLYYLLMLDFMGTLSENNQARESGQSI